MQAPQLANILFLVGLAMVIVVMLRQTNRYFKRKSAEIQRQDQRPPARMDLPADLARYEVQLHELARELSGQLDTKIHIVQQLVREVEAHTARLEAAIARAQRLAQSPAEEAIPAWDEAETAEAHTSAPLANPLPADEVYRLSDAGFTSLAIAERLDASIGDVEMLLSLRARSA